MKIGVAGIGRLGSAVAERLLGQGFSVAVWNRSRAKLAPLQALGAQACETPAELARDSDCVFTLLTDVDAHRAVYLGQNGLLDAPPERLFVEMSTLRPQAHQEMAEQVRSRGSAYLECPVAGSRDAALTGSLIGLAAGHEVDLARARPALDALCRRVERVGDVGAAASVKLALNLPLIVYYEVLPEALRLVDHLGLDPALMIDLLADSPGGPNLLRSRGGAIADAIAGREPGAALSTAATFAKDLRMMLAEAQAKGASLPMVAAALQQIVSVIDQHGPDTDSMRLPALLAKRAG